MNFSRRLLFLSGVATLVGPALPATADEAAPMMTPDRFWNLIDGTAPFSKNPDEQLEALAGSLRQLSLVDVVAFDTAFTRAMGESYSWDLWGAAYVVHGGLSDDGFDDFRAWLISKGRAVFERALADPDSLADLDVSLVDGVMQFQLFAYVAANVWAELSGRDASEMPSAPSNYLQSDPTGEVFGDDPKALAKRYPKVSRKYGRQPLG